MRILSIKGVLLWCLAQVLFNNREEKITSFTNFSHKVEGDPYFFFKSALKSSTHWRRIPLKRKQTSSQLLYISALPQLWASNRNSHRELSLAAFSEEAAKQLSRVRFKVTLSDPDHSGFSTRFISQLWDEFQIETQRPGWISWELSSTGIDMWIQQNQNGFQTDRKYPLIDIRQNSLNQVNHSAPNHSNKVDRDHSITSTNLTATQSNVNNPNDDSSNRLNHHLQTNRFQSIHSPSHQIHHLTQSPADITQPSAEAAPPEASVRHLEDTINTPQAEEGATTASGSDHVVIDTDPSRTKPSPLAVSPTKTSLAETSTTKTSTTETATTKTATTKTSTTKTSTTKTSTTKTSTTKTSTTKTSTTKALSTEMETISASQAKNSQANSSPQRLKNRPAHNHSRQQQTAQAIIWEAQYTHARCCTLLRLWEESLLQSATNEPKPNEPPLASLLLSSPPPSCVERIDTPHTQNLVQALTAIADSMFWIPYRWPAKQYFLFRKASTQLCQSFEAFYRAEMSGFHNHIATHPTPTQTKLALQFQARFALVLATQNSLKVLLESHLDAEAPTEL